ncbi:MAG: GtrA-like protein [Firmicutes bacterium ADurb.Bin193]|nr:MAG: GtrA-like protein [Firmicutes bacterium ADurb.Bin193]
MITVSKGMKEKILYLFFGGLTTVVNMGSYFVLVNAFGVHYLVSNAVAFVLAVVFAYITNRKYVFEAPARSREKIIIEAAGFFGFRGLSGLADMLFMFLMVDVMGINNTISKICVNVFVVIINYLFSKFIIFRPTKNE